MGNKPEEETPPWAGAAIACIGWVPTADGHLSFSLIGKGTRPACHRYSRAYKEQVGDNTVTRRMVVAFQQRQNRDAPLIVRMFRPGTKHYWLLTGKTARAKYPTPNQSKRDVLDEQGMLLGTILILPYQSFFEINMTANHGRDKIRHLLRSNQTQGPAYVENTLLEQVRWLERERVETVRVNFALFRTGELHLWMDQSQTDKLRPGDGHELGSGGQFVRTPEMSMQECILRQAYFFVKDAAHFHSHHDGGSDQLTPLVLKQGERDNPETGLSCSELQWQRETLWGLSRAIEELVRRGTRTSLRNALGLISFAESFQATLAGYVRKDGKLNVFGEEKNFHDYDLKSLKESVKVSLERQTWSLAGKAAMAGSTFAIGLSAVAAANVVGNRKGDMWEGPVADALYQCPPMFPVSTVVLLGLAFLMIYREADFLRAIFVLENFFSRLVRSHVKWLLTPYTGRKKQTISVGLSFLAFVIALYGLWTILDVAYGFLNFCGVHERPQRTKDGWVLISSFFGQENGAV